MQETALYRPYKFYKWIALFLLIFESLFMFLMILAYHFSPNLYGVFYLMLVFAFFIATATYFYIEYSRVILFGQSEIQIFENKVRKKYLWTIFSNAYYSVPASVLAALHLLVPDTAHAQYHLHLPYKWTSQLPLNNHYSVPAS